MSKRNTKKLNFPTVRPASFKRDFATLNSELHKITVSTPILFFIQKLIMDKDFRDKVTRLL